MNPKLLQSGPPGQVPLVLIHDGGGTCVQYCRLPRLGRPVWAIQHPRRAAKESWKGGIPEMARVYLELVRTVIPKGPLLLGGWSFGGVVAIEMALQLAAQQQSNLTVLGCVLIDSVFPNRDPGSDKSIWQNPPLCPAGAPLHVKREIRLCMAMSVALLDRWSTPQRNGTIQNQHYSNLRSSTPPGQTTIDTLKHDTLGIPTPPGTPELVAASLHGQLHHRSKLPAPPMTILLRARDPVPVPPEHEREEDDNTVSRVDMHRNKLLLGWESYPQEFIQAVMHVSGHHFSMFDPENIQSLGEHLDQACRMLDQGGLWLQP